MHSPSCPCPVACCSVIAAAVVHACTCRTFNSEKVWTASGWRPARMARGLVLAFGAAFDPMLYVLLAPLLAMALIASLARRSWVGVRRVVIVLAVPPALLMPWSARLWHHPALLVLGVGQPSAQLQARRLPAIDMLLLHPGGPSLPPIWLDAVIALAALAGLLQLTRPGAGEARLAACRSMAWSAV